MAATKLTFVLIFALISTCMNAEVSTDGNSSQQITQDQSGSSQIVEQVEPDNNTVKEQAQPGNNSQIILQAQLGNKLEGIIKAVVKKMQKILRTEDEKIQALMVKNRVNVEKLAKELNQEQSECVSKKLNEEEGTLLKLDDKIKANMKVAEGFLSESEACKHDAACLSKVLVKASLKKTSIIAAFLPTIIKADFKIMKGWASIVKCVRQKSKKL